MADIVTFRAEAMWDEEARVWYISDSDVPGLAAEAATVEEMAQKLTVLIPELVELNGAQLNEYNEVPFELVARKQESVRIVA